MKEVSDAIRKHDNYAVVSHVNMEGDALGSQIALYLMLKQLGKKTVMLSADPVPERLSFMAHQEKVVVVGQGDVVDFDTALLADCPTIDRTGSVAESIKKAKVRINLDHHISNNRFGDFNWVDPEASS